MTIRMLLALGLAAFLLVGLQGSRHQVNAQGEHQMIAQSLSSRCATPAGICLVTPQPIGTPCFCGQNYGTIIP